MRPAARQTDCAPSMRPRTITGRIMVCVTVATLCIAFGSGTAGGNDEVEAKLGKSPYGVFMSPKTEVWNPAEEAVSPSTRARKSDPHYFQSFGQYSRHALEVFRLTVEELLPADRPGFMRFFTPYVLGGKARVPYRADNIIGRDIPGSKHSRALHIGGGGRIPLFRSLFLSLDYSKVVHTGRLSTKDHSAYRVGLDVRY